MDKTIERRKRDYLIEPSIFLWMFAMVTADNIFTDLVIYRTCRILLATENASCSILHDDSSSQEAKNLQGLVQPFSSTTLMLKSLCDNLLPSFMTLFIGPWSDKFGRKPILLVAYTGSMLMFLMLAFIANFDVDTKFLLLASIPYALSGGSSGMYTASLCYVSDVADAVELPMRIVLVNVTFNLGTLCGMFAGPAIFNAFGYTAVFSVSALSCLLAALYVAFFVSETVFYYGSVNLKSFIDLQVIRDLYETIAKPRVGMHRSVVWCCVLGLVILLLIQEGESNIAYMFTTARFGWNVQDYADYSATSVVASVFGDIVAVKFFRSLLGFSETAILMVISAFTLSSEIIIAFALKTWHMYSALGFGMFGGVLNAMIQSIISKSIPPQDVGKIFCITIFLETITELAASALYTEAYVNFMPPVYYPCPVWLISAMFVAVNMFLAAVIHVLLKRNDQVLYQPL